MSDDWQTIGLILVLAGAGLILAEPVVRWMIRAFSN